MKYNNIFNDELFDIENTYNTDIDLFQFNNIDYYPKQYHYNNKFCSSKEGFLKGNLYANEYKPYKNMTYLPIEIKSDKEEKLSKIYEYSFVLTDLNFYLDLNPNDKESYHLFKLYVSEYQKAKEEYEKNYGPLCLIDTNGPDFNWIDNPWPWNNDWRSKYD